MRSVAGADDGAAADAAAAEAGAGGALADAAAADGIDDAVERADGADPTATTTPGDDGATYSCTA